MNFYHGTSDVLLIKHIILPPVKTGIKREEWRNKFRDKVFFTNSLPSAIMYSKKACSKYGGTPIVYKVKPIGDTWNVNSTEFVANMAVIVSK